MIACNRSSAASTQRGSCRKTAQGKCASPERFPQRTFAEIIKLPARGFRQNAITIFRWCIIAPYSRIGFSALIPLLGFLSILKYTAFIRIRKAKSSSASTWTSTIMLADIESRAFSARTRRHNTEKKRVCPMKRAGGARRTCAPDFEGK